MSETASVHDYYDRPPLETMCPECWGDVVERREASPFAIDARADRNLILFVCTRHERVRQQRPSRTNGGRRSSTWRSARTT
jgi:hypothetical protein